MYLNYFNCLWFGENGSKENIYEVEPKGPISAMIPRPLFEGQGIRIANNDNDHDANDTNYDDNDDNDSYDDNDEKDNDGDNDNED